MDAQLLEILPYALAFIAGFIVKFVDWLDDERKSKNPVKYLLAIFYGVLIGYLIGTANFSAIFLAALVAQVFARKIDTLAHRIGFITSAVSLLLFGLPSMDVALLIYFLVLAFLDEVDFVGWLRPLTEYRPFLKVGPLAPALMFGRWEYFAGIIAFDMGYELFNGVKKHIKRKGK